MPLCFPKCAPHLCVCVCVWREELATGLNESVSFFSYVHRACKILLEKTESGVGRLRKYDMYFDG